MEGVLLAPNKQLLHPVSPHTVLGKEVSRSSLLDEGFLQSFFVFVFTSSEQLFSRHLRGDPGTSPHPHPCPRRQAHSNPPPKHSGAFSFLTLSSGTSLCEKKMCAESNSRKRADSSPAASHRQKMLPLPTLRHLSGAGGTVGNITDPCNQWEPPAGGRKVRLLGTQPRSQGSCPRDRTSASSPQGMRAICGAC